MGKDGNAKKILEKCRFGVTVIENVYASDDNPLKRGIYVRTKRIRAAMNSGIFLELTDGEGEFWTTPIEAVKIVSAQLAERDAEIAALRQQVAELQADITELYANIGTIQREAAELKEWKAAVPVASIKRLLRAAPDDDVSEWIKFAEQ